MFIEFQCYVFRICHAAKFVFINFHGDLVAFTEDFLNGKLCFLSSDGGCEKSHIAFVSFKTTSWNQKVGKFQVIMSQYSILLYFILAKQKDLLLMLGDFN